MPNRMLTKIHGSEKALKKMKEIALVHVKVEAKDYKDWRGEMVHQDAYEYDHFDFEKIIPMPPHIYRGNLGKEEEEKYGKENCWYEWSIKHWGTKWNSDEFREGNGYISFQTAWSCPIPIIIKLSEMLKGEKLFIECSDEAIGNGGGRFYIEDGIMDEVEEDLQLSDEELYFAVWFDVPDDKCQEAFEEYKRDMGIDEEDIPEDHNQDMPEDNNQELPF